MSTPHSQLMREASAKQHKEAESSGFVTQLMKGELSLDAYAQYLANLAWVYEALEVQTNQGEPFVSSEPLWDERLDRLASIERDLEELGHPHWREEFPTSEALEDYCAQLTRLNGRADHRLIAHHYTRYLGDLSGGQAISALVARHYGATPEQLQFCTFTDIEDLVRYKEQYRANLDGLTLSDSQQDELVAEVQLAFELNKNLFQDLGKLVSA
jgi:heme oxygenase